MSVVLVLHPLFYNPFACTALCCVFCTALQGSWVKHGLDVQEEQLRSGMVPMQPGFGAERPSAYGVLDSQALELDPALCAPAPAGPLEALPELPEGTPTCASPAAAAASVAADAADAALEAATAAAMAGRVDSVTLDVQGGKQPAVTVSSIATAVLAKIDAGASSTPGASGSNGSTSVKVVTQKGCWYRFYEEVGSLLLASKGQCVPHMQHSSSGSSGHSMARNAETEAAGALMGSTSRGDEGRGGSFTVVKGGGVNSMLSVQPEAAADVIRVIELTLQSSKEGRTLVYANEQHTV